jgi:hypothetical protein
MMNAAVNTDSQRQKWHKLHFAHFHHCRKEKSSFSKMFQTLKGQSAAVKEEQLNKEVLGSHTFFFSFKPDC